MHALYKILIRRKCFFLTWFKFFFLLNPLNVKGKYSDCEFKYLLLLACMKIYENYNNKRTKEKHILVDK